MTTAKVHTLPRRGTRCPICRKPATAATAPFCSTRCRDVDLARWFGESYAIPAVEVDEADLEQLNEAEDKDA